MALQIQVKSNEENTLSLALDGQLDTITAPDLEQYLQNILTTAITSLVLDLQNLSFISSAGLRVLAKTRKTMKSREGKLYFINLTPQVKKVFDIVQAIPLSEVFSSTKELDAYLLLMQTKAQQEKK